MVGDPLGNAPPRRPTPPPDPKPGRASVLIVEPDVRVGRALQAAAAEAAQATLCQEFEGARSILEHAPPDVLVTNLRLEDYNGLHLVLLTRVSGLHVRCVVHTDRPDFLLVEEALAMGAFFEQTERLLFSIAGYVRGPLPAEERRNPQILDRRRSVRGGRRAADGRLAS